MTSLLANHNVMQIDKIGTKSISSLRPVAVVITDDSSIGRESFPGKLVLLDLSGWRLRIFSDHYRIL